MITIHSKVIKNKNKKDRLQAAIWSSLLILLVLNNYFGLTVKIYF